MRPFVEDDQVPISTINSALSKCVSHQVWADSFELKTGYLQFGGLLHLRRGFEISGEAMELGIHGLAIHLADELG
jgi:hypothetical protein